VSTVKTILAAVDNSAWTPVVAEYASDIAQSVAGELLAVFVVDSRLVEGAFARLLGETLPGSETLEIANTLAAMLERHGDEALDMVASVAERKGVKCEKRIERGRPAQALAAMAPLYDLAVLGSHGSEDDFRTCLMGSTTSELVRITTRPLLVVRKEYKPVRHVLVGYDGSPEATRALDTVVSLAQAAGWQLTIIVAADYEPTGHKLAAQAKQFRGLGDVQHQVKVLKGEASHVLLEAVDDEGADLVAIGARGRNKLARFLLGSTSDTLLCNASVPVMIFR